MYNPPQYQPERPERQYPQIPHIDNKDPSSIGPNDLIQRGTTTLEQQGGVKHPQPDKTLTWYQKLNQLLPTWRENLPPAQLPQHPKTLDQGQEEQNYGDNTNFHDQTFDFGRVTESAKEVLTDLVALIKSSPQLQTNLAMYNEKDAKQRLYERGRLIQNVLSALMMKDVDITPAQEAFDQAYRKEVERLEYTRMKDHLGKSKHPYGKAFKLDTKPYEESSWWEVFQHALRGPPIKEQEEFEKQKNRLGLEYKPEAPRSYKELRKQIKNKRRFDPRDYLPRKQPMDYGPPGGPHVQISPGQQTDYESPIPPPPVEGQRPDDGEPNPINPQDLLSWWLRANRSAQQPHPYRTVGLQQQYPQNIGHSAIAPDFSAHASQPPITTPFTQPGMINKSKPYDFATRNAPSTREVLTRARSLDSRTNFPTRTLEESVNGKSLNDALHKAINEGTTIEDIILFTLNNPSPEEARPLNQSTDKENNPPSPTQPLRFFADRQVPLDSRLKEIFDVLTSEEQSKASDMFPHLKGAASVIFCGNLISEHFDNGHWILIILDRHLKIIYLYDSFGNPLHPKDNPQIQYEIPDGLIPEGYTVQTNGYQLQHPSSATCGYWYCAFLYFNLNRNTMFATLKIPFNHLNDKTRWGNDIAVTDFYLTMSTTSEKKFQQIPEELTNNPIINNLYPPDDKNTLKNKPINGLIHKLLQR